MAVHVKNGTPVGNDSKCETCNHAHIILGFRESEQLVYCTFSVEMIQIPFKVRDCTKYEDRHRPTWEQMADLAIDVLPLSSAKPAGFRLSGDAVDEEIVEQEEPALAE